MARRFFMIAAFALLALQVNNAEPYPDRFVWVFGWSLRNDRDLGQITNLLERAARAGLNGAVLSASLDTLCKQAPDYFQRLDTVQSAAKKLGLDLIPSVFSVGYGGGALAHNRQLAEGLPVQGALFVARAGEARFVPESTVGIVNGGLENHQGNGLVRFGLQDQPGIVSLIDTQVVHAGKSAIRFENFKANPHGHGRLMQKVQVRPHRSYRLSMWVKTEDLEPISGFQMTVLANNRPIAPRTFDLASTTDWRKLTLLFNSLEFETVSVYAGMWGGQAGRLWLDDWTLEEVGPLNVLRRPGTPFKVTSEDGSMTYTEGTDFATYKDPDFNFYRVERQAAPLRLLAGSRIQNEQRLRVSWYHPLVIHDSQVTVCMAEPELYEIFEHEAKLLAEHLQPRRILLNMDEVRMGGTCERCRGRNMAELLGECLTRQSEILRRANPGARIYSWSDMLDPNHNARGNYYLVEGSFAGSWKHVPKDLIMAVWGGEPRGESLKFFNAEGFQTMVACYYDADNLSEVRKWMNAARPFAGVRGFMYTPWLKKYELLPEFGQLLNQEQNWKSHE